MAMTGARILVVDDEQLIRWSLAERLRAEGYDVLEAGTGARGARAARDGVDLVLLDYKLPDTDGVTVLQQIKELDPDIAGHPADGLRQRRHRGRGDEERRVSTSPTSRSISTTSRCWSRRRSRPRSCAARCARLRASAGAALQRRPHRRRVAGDAAAAARC